jgi:hypothetical protein
MADRIVAFLKETVDPPSWTDVQPQGGNIRYEDGLLVVKQTPKNHTLIRRRLKMLREFARHVVRYWPRR